MGHRQNAGYIRRAAMMADRNGEPVFPKGALTNFLAVIVAVAVSYYVCKYIAAAVNAITAGL